ncbi:hypothetical protein scyTo_0022476, partial [Scyliorhinus torazame]|nr:hypothetical protein [Scyliorhinus torazame]
MLLPCGLDRFRGVEYVCCPSRFQAVRLEDEIVPVAEEEETEEETKVEENEQDSRPEDSAWEQDLSPGPVTEEDRGADYQMYKDHWDDYKDMGYMGQDFYDEAVTESTTTTTTTEGTSEEVR